jgi:hypothetical protein
MLCFLIDEPLISFFTACTTGPAKAFPVSATTRARIATISAADGRPRRAPDM